MKRYLSILFFIWGYILCFAQQYPVRLVPVVFPPYNVRLSDYALNSEPKLQLQVLMTDLLEPPHKTGIKFSLESGGRVIAVSNPFVNGLEPFPFPAFLIAKTTARGRAEIQWTLQGASSKQFRVEYRKKGSAAPWLSETSYQTSAILSGLENNTEYEYRVGAVCGENKSFDPDDLSQADAFAYSGVQYFTTNFSSQNKNSAQCGVMPAVDLSNKKPYDRPLTPNEVFTAKKLKK